MKRSSLAALLGVALSLIPSSTAQAGVGLTAGGYALSDGTTWFPSVDYRSGPVLVQVRALDLIGQLPASTLDLGLGFAYAVDRGMCTENVNCVTMAGADLRMMFPFSFDSVALNAMGKLRVGAEVKKKYGFGVYVVPQLGASNFTGEWGLAYGGGVEISAWRNR